MSNQKPLNLFQKINLVMSKVSSVYKGSTVDMGNNRSYSAVSHDDVTALLHRPITEAGLVAIPNMDSAEVEQYHTEKSYQGNVTKTTGYMVKVWASVTFVDIDRPESTATTKCYAYAMDTGDKATGKAYSMAIKYCYLKTFMLESQDEEESRDNEKSYGDNQPNYSNPPKHNKQPTVKPPITLASGGLASPAQIGAIKKLYTPEDLPGVDLNNLSKNEASELIKNASKNKGK